jgi:membrane protein YqaA with SNARE-associated domain
MSLLKNLLAGALAALGPWAPFWIALTDSSFLPLAQAVDVMVVAQAVALPQQAYATAAMAVAGSTFGCFAAYLAARRAGRRVLSRFLAPRRSQQIEISLRRQGVWPLFMQTMLPLPLPMRLWVLGAGAFGMQPFRFIATVFLARCVRYFGLAFVTLTFGERVILTLKERAWLFAGLMLAGGLAWLVWRIASAKRSTMAEAPSARAATACREPSRQATNFWDEQTGQELVQPFAGGARPHRAPAARTAHGRGRAGLAAPSAACPSDFGAPLQPRLHVLQRI